MAINPYEHIVAEITPTEFEKYCIDILNLNVQQFGVSDYSFEHNKIMEAPDGSYQLDGYIEYKMMNVTFKIIIECKKYSSSIEREKVEVLNDKVRCLGANKGILIASSGFQSGAIKYAKAHGIALLQIVNGEIMTIQGATRQSKVYLCIVPPKYICLLYDLDIEFPLIQITPSNNQKISEIVFI